MQEQIDKQPRTLANLLGALERPLERTILVVEPEIVTLATTSSALKKAGYRVLNAKTALEAALLWHQEKGAVDVIVADLNIRDIKKLVREFRKEHPALKILFTSTLGEINGDPASFN